MEMMIEWQVMTEMVTRLKRIVSEITRYVWRIDENITAMYATRK